MANSKSKHVRKRHQFAMRAKRRLERKKAAQAAAGKTQAPAAAPPSQPKS